MVVQVENNFIQQVMDRIRRVMLIKEQKIQSIKKIVNLHLTVTINRHIPVQFVL